MARHVFLSFVEEDLELVRLFRGQAKNEKSDVEFSDHSVQEPFDSTNAEYIRRRIRELLTRVSVTVVLIGETTYTSSWVDWEIRTTASLGGGLVGMRLHSLYKDAVPKRSRIIGPKSWIGTLRRSSPPSSGLPRGLVTK